MTISASAATLAREGAIATLTLDRPDARNALSLELIEAMHTHVHTLAAMGDDDRPTVLVVRGAGKAFCAGMDLKAVIIPEGGDGSTGLALLSALAEFTLALRDLSCVTIASVRGAAIGGGCGLACACDLTISHADAKLGFPEVDLGLCPAVVAPWVVQKIGAGRARAVLLRGGVMSGEDAAGLGLVDHLASDASGLDALTASVAGSIAAGGPLALARTKALLNTFDEAARAAVHSGAALSADTLATAPAQAALRARMG